MPITDLHMLSNLQASLSHLRWLSSSPTAKVQEPFSATSVAALESDSLVRVARLMLAVMAFAAGPAMQLSHAAAASAELRQVHDGPVSILLYDLNQRLYSAGWDGTIRRWVSPPDRVATMMRVPAGRVTAFAVCDAENYLVAAASDDWLHRFDLSSGARQGSLEPLRPIGIRSLVLTSDCKELLVGSGDQTLRHWRVSDGKDLSRPKMLDAGALRAMLPSPTDSGRIAVGTRKEGVLLWASIDAKAPVALKRSGNNRVVNMAWHPEGHQLAVAYGDRKIVIWDLSDVGKASELSATHGDDIKGIAYALGGRMLISGDLLGVVLAHRPGSTEAPCVLLRLPEQSGVMSLAVRPDGAALAVGTLLGEVAQWNIPDLVARARCK